MFRLSICILSIAAIAMADSNNVSKLLARGTNQFTAKMFTEVVKSQPDKSVVMSAFSVMPPLAQLGIASVGESHDELLQSIGMPNDNTTKAAFSQFNSKVKSTKDVELRMASKIYVAENYELNQEFAAVSKDVFESEVQNLNFIKNVESSKEINLWVEDKTNHRIKDLVSPDMLGPDTRAVLVNAIYFKGAWKNPFAEPLTIDRDFHVSKNKIIKVPTMYVKNDFKYVESIELNAQVIELPYEGDSASMIIVLPKDIDGIYKLEEKLRNPDILDNIYDTMTEREVEVYLPKFKIETTTDLKQVLQNMNVKQLFVPGQARLDNLLKGTNNLYVSDAIQKAFIEVNEKGAEAAAANAFGVALTSIITNPKRRPIFRADRPFYFVVKANSLPLFSAIRIVPFSLQVDAQQPPVFEADRPFYFIVKVNSLPLFSGVKIIEQ